MMFQIRILLYSGLLLLFLCADLVAEDGYRLWLRYEPITEPVDRSNVEAILRNIWVGSGSATFGVIREELVLASSGMLGSPPGFITDTADRASLVIGTLWNCELLNSPVHRQVIEPLGDEGYMIDRIELNGIKVLVIAANEPVGALYGTFHLLRMLQSEGGVSGLPILEAPKVMHRLLNHWDNLDRTVERGYAGFSIWDWHRLPNLIDPRYRDYARANASIGINSSVITNVNANAWVLTPSYLEKVAALADLFRPYGIRIYLTARFSAPREIGGLETSDPVDPEVRQWWIDKASEIYSRIPDFGGFLVKANSEGQPGPQNYGRTHADGANMLAEAVAPFGGIVMWRAFVYSADIDEDRAKQAYNEFVPLDGQFLDNVIVQVKNGPVDFQPREPFHPLFAAMPGTALAPEFQITQEYLGQGTHLAYLAPLFKECLDADTYIPNKGSTVARIMDGSVYPGGHTAVAGVSNIGTDRNWTGHLFGQANWYAFGRLAWDHDLTSEEIAKEWIRLSFGDDPVLGERVLEIMMQSREAVVQYMTPLGLHHIMGRGHHYGPGPWVTGGRADWTSVYYHRADSTGIGFDRTGAGSDALSQYAPEIAVPYSDPATCPEEYLLWFHHLPWDYVMKSGHTLWKELCMSYDRGVRMAREMKSSWEELEELVDRERFIHVREMLHIQELEAAWWRNACLLYFRQFSGMPFPPEIEQPEGYLENYMELEFPYAPGN